MGEEWPGWAGPHPSADTTPTDTAHRIGTRRRAQRCCCCCDCDHEPTLTDADVRAWVAAVNHLTGVGLTPLVDIEVCRALWRHGQRDLAMALARMRGAA